MFIWNGAPIRTGLELVQAMRADWSQATEFLNRWPDKPFRDWLLTRPQGQVLTQVMDLEVSGDGRLIRLQARFDPNGPLEFMGRAVSDESLNKAIATVSRWSPASTGRVSEAHVWLGAIRDQHVFRSIAGAVEADSTRLIRADQLLNNWDQSARAFLTTVRQHVSLEQSTKSADAAENHFKELIGLQFAAALSGNIPGQYGDQAQTMAAKIQRTLGALTTHELLPKASPWANGQRARDTLLNLASQVIVAPREDLGLQVPASVYLDMMEQVCAHDLSVLRAEADRIRHEREARDRAEREARERAEREARERAEREARQAIERAEAEKKRLEEATRSARTAAAKWWDERLIIEQQTMQSAEDERTHKSIEKKREELREASDNYKYAKAKDTNGRALVGWLALSIGALAVIVYAANVWGPNAVVGAFIISGIFLGGGLFWGLYPLLGAFEEVAKGTSAKKAFRTRKAQIDTAIAGLTSKQIRLVRIPVDKVGTVIGKGGDTIKRITKPGITVDIQGWHEAKLPLGRANPSTDTERGRTVPSRLWCIREDQVGIK